ncbi:MAG: sigma-70 family RNA polymerase sigma factor [Gammaproteobacteria bacterium]|nr:sigma-70 family RNA polymerase sigma factor [Gammaproteobacteria bacterium]
MDDLRQARFEALADEFSTDLYRYAMWLCGDRVVAEDLVQECFLRAWRSLDSLKDERSAKSWLFTILRRENARLHERQRPETGQIDTSQLEDSDRYDTTTEAFVLRRALAALPQNYREPLILQVLGGFSTEQIGEMLGMSKSAVMTRVFRARKRLRGVLSGNSKDVPSKVKI